MPLLDFSDLKCAISSTLRLPGDVLTAYTDDADWLDLPAGAEPAQVQAALEQAGIQGRIVNTAGRRALRVAQGQGPAAKRAVDGR